MKVRQGFVSNSSSSSFVVLIPEDFDVESITEDQIRSCESFEDILDYFDEDKEAEQALVLVKKAVSVLKSGETLWKCGYGENDDLHMVFYLTADLIRDFVVGSMDSGPDDGRIVSGSMKVAKNVVSGEERVGQIK